MKKFLKRLFCNHKLEIVKQGGYLIAVCENCEKPLPQHPLVWQQIQTWDKGEMREIKSN